VQVSDLCCDLGSFKISSVPTFCPHFWAKVRESRVTV